MAAEKESAEPVFEDQFGQLLDPLARRSLQEAAIVRLDGRTADVYKKVGRRGAMEVAIVGLAIRLSVDQAGTINDARIAVCSVAPVPFRAQAAEQALLGTKANGKETGSAAALLLEQVEPIDDVRATANYRRMVLPRIFESAVADCYLLAAKDLS